MTGVEKTVRPLMLLRAGVSEPPKNTIPRRPAWFLVKMISKRRRYDRLRLFRLLFLFKCHVIAWAYPLRQVLEWRRTQESGDSLSPRAETSVPFSLSAQKGELNVVAITRVLF